MSVTFEIAVRINTDVATVYTDGSWDVGSFLVGHEFLGYAIFPAVVEMLIREELDIWNPESEGRKNFVSIIAIEMKVSTKRLAV